MEISCIDCERVMQEAPPPKTCGRCGMFRCASCNRHQAGMRCAHCAKKELCDACAAKGAVSCHDCPIPVLTRQPGINVL